MTSMIKVDEIQNSAGTTTLAKFENGQLTGALSPATGFKNRLINGDMRIDQRNAGASVTNAVGGLYTLDRWIGFGSQASKYTVQRNAGSVTPPVGFINYLGVTSSSAYTVGASEQFSIVQAIEGLNVSDLGFGTANAKTVTLSAWVRSSLTGTFGGSLRNSAVNRSYPFTYTISSANTWTQISITIPGDTTGTWLTTNGVGIYVAFAVGAGASLSGTAGSWQAGNLPSATGATSVVGTNGATWQVTGVQLEKGTVATPFEFRSIGQELGLCYRYYQQIGGTAGYLIGGYSLAAADDYGTYTLFPVTMRAAPTATVTGTWDTANTTTTEPKVAKLGVNGAIIFATVSSTGGWYIDANSADDLIKFSAEL